MSSGQEWGLIALIGLIVFIVVPIKKTKASIEEERKMTNSLSSEEKPLHISLNVSNSADYKTIVGRLGSVVDQVARKCANRSISTLIMIRKETENTSYISFQMEDIDFERFGVTFSNEFKVDDYRASYETHSATGFTTADAAKRELLIHFNWSDISVNTEELRVTDFGDYVDTPLIVFRFEFRYSRY